MGDGPAGAPSFQKGGGASDDAIAGAPSLQRGGLDSYVPSDDEITDFVDKIKTDYRTADLAPPARAVLDFTTKLTKTPGLMEPADVEILRTHGFDDRAIHDIVQVIAYFNYINRIADGLGVDLEPNMPPK